MNNAQQQYAFNSLTAGQQNIFNALQTGETTIRDMLNANSRIIHQAISINGDITRQKLTQVDLTLRQKIDTGNQQVLTAITDSQTVLAQQAASQTNQLEQTINSAASLQAQHVRQQAETSRQLFLQQQNNLSVQIAQAQQEQAREQLRKDFLKSLWFPSINTRQESLRPEHKGTFSWILGGRDGDLESSSDSNIPADLGSNEDASAPSAPVPDAYTTGSPVHSRPDSDASSSAQATDTPTESGPDPDGNTSSVFGPDYDAYTAGSPLRSGLEQDDDASVALGLEPGAGTAGSGINSDSAWEDVSSLSSDSDLGNRTRHVRTVHGPEGAAGQDFLRWLKTGDDVYWIVGKAGSGKSTLMNFICQDARTKAALDLWAGDKQLVMLSFFFFMAGTYEQRHVVGLLKSLLRNLLVKGDNLVDMAMDICKHDINAVDIATYAWSEVRLRSLLSSILRSMQNDARLCIFIDGLDEYVGDAEDLSRYMLELSQLPHVKICVSSRPIQTFHYDNLGSPRIKLEDLNREDIKALVFDRVGKHRRMQELRRTNKWEVNPLLHEVVSRAQGVFLWVVFVLSHLLEGLKLNDDFATLRQRLDTVKFKDLDGLYALMLSKMPEPYRQEVAELIILTMTLDRLSVFHLAVRHDSSLHEEILACKVHESFQDLIAARLVQYKHLCANVELHVATRCANILEIVNAEYSGLDELPDRAHSIFGTTSRCVVLVHRSAKEFFSNQNNINQLLTIDARKNDLGPSILQGLAHSALALLAVALWGHQRHSHTEQCSNEHNSDEVGLYRNVSDKIEAWKLSGLALNAVYLLGDLLREGGIDRNMYTAWMACLDSIVSHEQRLRGVDALNDILTAGYSNIMSRSAFGGLLIDGEVEMWLPLAASIDNEGAAFVCDYLRNMPEKSQKKLTSVLLLQELVAMSLDNHVTFMSVLGEALNLATNVNEALGLMDSNFERNTADTAEVAELTLWQIVLRRLSLSIGFTGRVVKKDTMEAALHFFVRHGADFNLLIDLDLPESHKAPSISVVADMSVSVFLQLYWEVVFDDKLTRVIPEDLPDIAIVHSLRYTRRNGTIGAADIEQGGWASRTLCWAWMYIVRKGIDMEAAYPILEALQDRDLDTVQESILAAQLRLINESQEVRWDYVDDQLEVKFKKLS